MSFLTFIYNSLAFVKWFYDLYYTNKQMTNMTKQEIKNLKVTHKSADAIRGFVYEQRETLSFTEKDFYSSLAGMVDREVKHTPAAYRATMPELFERAGTIYAAMLVQGALSVETHYVKA